MSGPKGGVILGANKPTAIAAGVRAGVLEQAQENTIERQRVLESDLERQAQAAAEFDLMEFIGKHPEAFDIEIANWNILICMVDVPDKMGRFFKSREQIQAENLWFTVAQVIKVGPTALVGKTESGIPLSEITASINCNEGLVGKYVMTQRYTGAEVFWRREPGKRLRIITASDILAVVKNPQDWLKA